MTIWMGTSGELNEQMFGEGNEWPYNYDMVVVLKDDLLSIDYTDGRKGVCEDNHALFTWEHRHGVFT